MWGVGPPVLRCKGVGVSGQSEFEQGRVNREQSWIMAKNLLKSSGVEYDAPDLMNLAMYLNGDLNMQVVGTSSYAVSEEETDDESSN